jgi:large subunit ribosomal protein L30e
MVDVNKAIASAVKTGKVWFGTNNAIKNVKVGKAKLVIIAENCPENFREDIEYYCKLSKVPMIIYKGTSLDLGAICGKPFMISALTIREQGDSDILKIAGATNV